MKHIKPFKDMNSINESHIDYEVLNRIEKTEAHKTLRKEFSDSIKKFNEELANISDEIGYDDGDSDHDMAYYAAIQNALDNNF